MGERAADDEQLSQMLGELMDKSNPPGRGDGELLERYTKRLDSYVSTGEEGSLVRLFDEAPVTHATKPARQVTHWLFALGDTLAINALRCLALLATHQEERERVRAECVEADPGTGAGVGSLHFLEACLQDAMRLWPTTAMLSRELARDTDWDGVSVAAGTQVLIVNTFNHRDREAFACADRFAPEQWLQGAANDDWSFNHFSHGPQGCPGTGLALLVGKAMLATMLREHDARLLQPSLDPAKPLPCSLDYFGLRVELSPRA